MKTLSKEKREQVELYAELLQRYRNLDAQKMLPFLAIRLLCLRFGLEVVIQSLRTNGEDIVTSAALAQLSKMADTWRWLLTLTSPPSNVIEQMRGNVGMLKSGANSKQVGERIFQALIRLRMQDDYIRQKARGK